jgi:hypothetical protein
MRGLENLHRETGRKGSLLEDANSPWQHRQLLPHFCCVPVCLLPMLRAQLLLILSFSMTHAPPQTTCCRYTHLLRLVESTRDFETEEQVECADTLKAALLSNLALTAFQQEEYARCIEWCDKTLQVDPNNAKVGLWSLGDVGAAVTGLGTGRSCRSTGEHGLEAGRCCLHWQGTGLTLLVCCRKRCRRVNQSCWSSCALLACRLCSARARRCR